MIARMTWQPDGAPKPETVTVKAAAAYITVLQELLAAGRAYSNTTLTLHTASPNGQFTPRTYPLARITSITTS